MATAKEKYDAARRNQATMQQVENLLIEETTSVLTVARDFERQEFGGFLRQVVPVLVDKYGNVNAVAAMQYYDEQRRIWWEGKQRAGTRSGRQSQQRRAERYASARLRGEIYVARMPEFNLPEKTDPIINWTMKRFAETGFDIAAETAKNAMTRAVASYNRDVMLYNAALDRDVVKVQRVAEPGACSFCRLMAFSSSRSASGDSLDVRTASYAVDFHDNCRCSIETLYQGDEAIRPPYYEQFEQNYLQATTNVGASNARSVINEMQRLANL